MVSHDTVSMCSRDHVNRPVPSVRRLQAMQKMQSAAGGRGRGANGMPTPAQIQAMQVCRTYRSRWFISFNMDTQRSMPPGMLQQMQRQLRGGGGMQEMMKTMMQGQGGDQLDMEEMQSTLFFLSCRLHSD